MTSRRVAVWAGVGIALVLLFMVGAALLLSWMVRADALIWLWIAIGVAVVAEVLLLARRPEGRDWLRRRWWLIAMQLLGIVIVVVAQVIG